MATRPFVSYPAGPASALGMYRADGEGIAASFTRQDTAHGPANVAMWAIAIDSADVIHVVYVVRDSWSGTGFCSHLFYVTFDTATNTWGTPVALDTGLNLTEYGQGDELASIALDASGGAHVVYLKNDGSRRRLTYRTNAGGGWSDAVTVDDRPFGPNERIWHPAIAFDNAGRMAVLWHKGTFNDTPDGRNYIRVYDGSWGATAEISGTNIYTGIDTTSAFYVDASNRYHAAWLSTNKYIRYAYSDDLGATWTLNSPSNTTGDDPQVGPGPDNQVRLYAHGTNSTPNITYWEGSGSGDWGRG